MLQKLQQQQQQQQQESEEKKRNIYVQKVISPNNSQHQICTNQQKDGIPPVEVLPVKSLRSNLHNSPNQLHQSLRIESHEKRWRLGWLRYIGDFSTKGKLLKKGFCFEDFFFAKSFRDLGVSGCLLFINGKWVSNSRPTLRIWWFSLRICWCRLKQPPNSPSSWGSMQVSHSCFKYSWHLTLFPAQKVVPKKAVLRLLKTSFNDLKTSMLLPNQPIDPLISQPPHCPSRALRLSHVAVVHMLPLVVQPCKSRDGEVIKNINQRLKVPLHTPQ